MDANNGQAIVITGQWKFEVVPHGAVLVAWMEARGFKLADYTPSSGRLRPELQCQPQFHGLIGPCWGGPEHPAALRNAGDVGDDYAVTAVRRSAQTWRSALSHRGQINFVCPLLTGGLRGRIVPPVDAAHRRATTPGTE